MLESDPHLPSVVSLVAGKPIAGSWWGHPSGGAIYREVQRLSDDADVALTKLVGGKVTFVHRTLWPCLVAVGRSREPWQVSSLSDSAHALLDLVGRVGKIRSDDPRCRLAAGSHVSAAVLELERRLLVMATQIHTQQGRHAKTIESWSHWGRRVGAKGRISVAAARAELERRVGRLNRAFNAKRRLPWQP